MNTFAKILFTFLLGALSSNAFAVTNPTYAEVKAAIENTLAKVEEAQSALDNDTDKAVLIDLISDARQLQKDIANNALDVKRNRASSVLKKARSAVKNDDLVSARSALNDAANRYKEIQRLYASTH
ncbi:hypothetical protein [Methylotuvimicrobium sp. KM1]|uniref:hypothetical protein n=1 Tax=Methylotuvimicrobium sp. KM1 TaxID=3377707 RepID=UPI00384F858B